MRGGALCRFLEEELARRYRDAAPVTLSILQDRCKAVMLDLAEAEAQLLSMKDVSSLRESGAPDALQYPRAKVAWALVHILRSR
jgi:hypothetical protein